MQERDAIVKVTLASICSSDLHIKHGSVPRAVPGITVGHEMVGIVEEVGKAVTKVKPGDRVTVNVETFCGECFFCKKGYVNNCTDENGGWALGCPDRWRPGGICACTFADQGLNKIPDGVTDRQALLVGDVLATGYWAARISEISEQDTVLIIGAGGLGAPAALYLAAAGVGTIGIADADEVDLSNLQRQVIHTTADVGKLKVESAAETMKAINPDVTVNTYHTFVDSSNIMDLIKDYDFILDGTDNFPAKFLINDACVMAEKPFSHAGIIRFQGQLMTYVPGQGPCYRCAFQSPPPKDSVPTCKQAGVIGAMGGVIGSLQAMEAIKYIIGQGDLLTGRLLTYDALKMTFRTVKLPKNHHCPVCGDDPTITELIDYEQAVCELKH